MIPSLLDAIAAGWARYLLEAAEDLERQTVMATPAGVDEILDLVDTMRTVASDLMH